MSRFRATSRVSSALGVVVAVCLGVTAPAGAFADDERPPSAAPSESAPSLSVLPHPGESAPGASARNQSNGALWGGHARGLGRPEQPPTSARAAAPLPDLDDFHGIPAYTKYYTQQPLWDAATCPKPDYPWLKKQCATLTVPLDWYHLDQGEITIGISRALDDAGAPKPRRDRLLLTNPGGPGLSGLEYGLLIGIYGGTDETHTPIGIDPRGVGLSTHVDCLQPAPAPDGYLITGDSRVYSKAQVLAESAHVEKALAECYARNSRLMQYMNTDQTARDFNMVRAVMGYAKTDFEGVGYGTLLGSIYDKMFTSTIDRLVLDSNHYWQGEWHFANMLQPEAFQAAFDRQFIPFLARHDSVYHLGSTTAATDATYERVRARSAKREYGTDITPDRLDARLATALYSVGSYDDAGQALATLAPEKPDPTKLAALAASFKAQEVPAGRSMGPARTLARVLQCTDNVTFEGDGADWLRIHDKFAPNYPLIGARLLVDPCRGWPVHAALSRDVVARPLGQALLLHNEGDPVAPYKGAANDIRAARGTLRMVVIDDQGGHGTWQATPCSTNARTNYLATGAYPSGNVYCQAAPMRSGDVADSAVYAFGGAPVMGNPLPAVLPYLVRDHGDPKPETTPAPPSSLQADPTNQDRGPKQDQSQGQLQRQGQSRGSSMPTARHQAEAAIHDILVHAAQLTTSP